MRWMIGCLILASCVESEPLAIARVQPHSQAEVAFATSVLNGLQAQSIAQNREFCGYIGVGADGQFLASEPTRGRKGSCRSRDPKVEMDILASYHTHGGYSDGFDSEIPSPDDLKGDIEEGVDGYISTPGGRVWFNDALDAKSQQVCGRECVMADPEFVEDYDVPNVMTLDDLKKW